MAHKTYRKILTENYTANGDKTTLSFKGHDGDIHFVGTTEEEGNADLSQIAAIKRNIEVILNSLKDTCFSNGVPKVDWSQTVYTITSSLSHVSSSNPQARIAAGYSFDTELTVDDDNGYSWGSITVTMGGVDVTSSVVTVEDATALERHVTIGAVTGNVVITATGTK